MKKNKVPNVKSPQIAKVDTRPTLVVFSLDRSGSMSSCKNETISGFNGYIDELKKKNNDDIRFTFTQFDSISIDTLYNCARLQDIKPLDEKSFAPRGNTPLYDALGKTIRNAEKMSKDYRILICTLTDGEENASSDWKLDSIRNLIKEKEDKDKWTFAHIGVGMNGWAAVKSYSSGTLSSSNVMNISSDQTRMAYKGLAGATMRYASNHSDNVTTDFWSSVDTKKDKNEKNHS